MHIYNVEYKHEDGFSRWLRLTQILKLTIKRYIDAITIERDRGLHDMPNKDIMINFEETNQKEDTINFGNCADEELMSADDDKEPGCTCKDPNSMVGTFIASHEKQVKL